jgi:hypothetical protein
MRRRSKSDEAEHWKDEREFRRRILAERAAKDAERPQAETLRELPPVAPVADKPKKLPGLPATWKME